MNSMTDPTSNGEQINDSARRERFNCPDWCISTHLGEDPADPINNLISHEAEQHFPGISVMRTDCPDEGRIGKPVLYVTVELELESWEQAAELAHAVLDGFGYLAGADRN